MNNFDGDLTVKGKTYSRQGFEGPMDRSQIITVSDTAFPLELSGFRVHDAFQTPLGAAAADDLGINGGAFGTNCPHLRTVDLNGLGATTAYGRTMFQLPVEYVAGGEIVVNLSAGLLAAVASVSASVDVEVFVCGRNGTKSGSDLVTTGATSMNSTTFADCPFVVNPAGITPGTILDIRVAIIANSTTASSHFAAIGAVEMLLDVKG